MGYAPELGVLTITGSEAKYQTFFYQIDIPLIPPPSPPLSGNMYEGIENIIK